LKKGGTCPGREQSPAKGGGKHHAFSGLEHNPISVQFRHWHPADEFAVITAFGEESTGFVRIIVIENHIGMSI